jgi:hypothetical protein
MLGPALSNAEAPITLVRRLKELGVPSTAELYWAGNRPQEGILFYDQRTVKHVLDPYTLITDPAKNQNHDGLRLAVARRVCTLFERPTLVYVVFHRGDLRHADGVFPSACTSGPQR